MTDLTEAFGCDDLRAQAARVRALARTVVADAHLADDVAQQLWLSRLTGRASARAGEPGWITGALRNLARRSWRADERRRQRERVVSAPAPGGSPAEAVQNAETLQLVVGAAMALEEPYRTTILLRYLEDRGVDDVASAMCVPPSTVRVRTKRGLEKLRQRLRGALGAAYAIVLLRFADAPPAVSVVPTGPSATAPTTNLQGTTSMKPLLFTTAAVSAVSIATVAFLWNQDPHDVAAPGATAVTVGAAAAPAGTVEFAPASGRQPVGDRELEVTEPATVGPALTGRVVDARGRALVGARVLAFEHRATRLYEIAELGAAQPVGSVTSDASGAFVLAGLPASSSWDFVIEADGYATVLQRHSTGADDRIVLQRDASVAGTVRDAAGHSVAGAVVRAAGCELHGAFRPWRETTTDARGTFRLSGLAAEQAQLLEIGRAGSVPDRFTVNLQARTENVREFELRPIQSVELTVVELDTGRAVAGAQVSWHGLAVDGLGRTDAYGVLKLEAPCDQPRCAVFDLEAGFLVHADGFSATLRNLDELAGKVTLPLVRSGRIEGVVRDAEGRTVAGAEVYWATQPFRFLSGKRAEGGMVLRGTALVGPDSRRTVTDARGRFALPQVVVAQAKTFVDHGRLAIRSGERTVSVDGALPVDSATPRDLQVSLQPGLVFAGRVLLNGEGDAAWINLEKDGLERSLRASVDGSFGLGDLPPGVYQLSAYSGSSSARAEPRAVEIDGDVRDYELRLSGEFAKVRGMVLRDDGSPAAGLTVKASLDGGSKTVASLDDVTDGETEETFEVAAEPRAVGFASGGASGSGFGTVGEDGRFTVAVDAAGDDARYVVSVFDRGFQVSAKGAEAGGEPVVLRVPSFVEVRFDIADLDDRAVVAARWEEASTGRSADLDPMLLIPTSDGIVMLRLPVGEVQVTLRDSSSDRHAVLDLRVPAAGFVEAVKVELK